MEKEDSVRAVLSQADDIDLNEGRLAYSRYHDLLQRLADHYNLPFKSVVAAFAATSPNNDYFSNLRSTASLCDSYVSGAGFERVTVSTYRAAALRGWRCLLGEDFLSFTKGLKTRSFYLNILEPDNPEPVTVDGHMISIWSGKRLLMKEAVRFNHYYADISDSVRAVARDAGMVPNQVQAVCWFVWKRIHKPVRGDGQLYLFDPEDHWRTKLLPEDVPPFNPRVEAGPQQLSLNLSEQLTLWP